MRLHGATRVLRPASLVAAIGMGAMGWARWQPQPAPRGELRDQLSIFQKISQIVAPQPIVNFMMNQRPELEAGPASVMNEREFEAVLKQVREYSTVKQILEGNSEKVIYNK